jgi:hypothetical protein
LKIQSVSAFSPISNSSPSFSFIPELYGRFQMANPKQTKRQWDVAEDAEIPARPHKKPRNVRKVIEDSEDEDQVIPSVQPHNQAGNSLPEDAECKLRLSTDMLTTR